MPKIKIRRIDNRTNSRVERSTLIQIGGLPDGRIVHQERGRSDDSGIVIIYDPLSWTTWSESHVEDLDDLGGCYATVQNRLLREYRRDNPASRVSGPYKYIKNGCNSPRQMACVLCGQEFPSWCGKWPMTSRARLAMADHRCSVVLTEIERLDTECPF